MLRALTALFVLLALPAAAHAGGWATVGLSSTPEGTGPGNAWVVDLEILQHGRTPLDDVAPAVLVTGAGETRRFEATATGAPGTYRAEVEFPRTGTYSYVVDDGFVGPVHTFPPVEIGGATAAAGGSGDGLPWPLLIAGALAAFVAAGGVALTRRRGQVAA